MKAAVLHRLATDPAGPLLPIEEVPEPEINDPHDVIVRITAAGVCRTDLHILHGELATQLPHIPGHENAGVVHAVGDQVTQVKPGDPVVCYPFLTDGLSRAERRGTDSHAPHRITPGIDAPGGFAQFLLTNERAMVLLPPGTDPLLYAPLTDAGLAAYRACSRLALAPSATVVVLGVGGLGHLAVQILRAITAARVVAVDPRPSARQLAIECGAHAAVEPQDLPASLTQPAAAVLDLVGSDDSMACGLPVLGLAGHYVAVGVGGNLQLPVLDLVTKELRIEGVYVGTYPDLIEVVALAQAGLVTPRLVTYPLADVAQALDDLAQGRITGRAVVLP